MLCSPEGAAKPGPQARGGQGVQDSRGLEDSRGAPRPCQPRPAELRENSRCPSAAGCPPGAEGTAWAAAEAPGPQRSPPRGTHPRHCFPGTQKTAGGLPRRTPSEPASGAGEGVFVAVCPFLGQYWRSFAPWPHSSGPAALSGGSSRRSPLGCTARRL